MADVVGPFWAPVVLAREASGDTVARVGIRVRVRRMTPSDVAALAPGAPKGITRRVLADVLTGWRGVHDEHGTTLLFDGGNLRCVLKNDGLVDAIAKAIALKASLREGR